MKPNTDTNINENAATVTLKRKSIFKQFISQWDLQIMIIPAIIFILIFSYIPMWGISFAFVDYDLFGGLSKSPWVGLKYFKEFFRDPNFGIIMRNTIFISVIKLAFVFPAPILLALMINEVMFTKFKRIFQTISYLPHFISWVTVGAFAAALMSVDSGNVNLLLMKLNLIKEPINWLSTPEYFWGILVVANTWKSIGYNAIIYLAAIAGINPELYEAASIDGASRFKQIWLITLPSIAPVIIMLLILAISHMMNAGFDDIMQLTNNGNNAILLSVSEVLDTYTFKMGIREQQFSYATAVGLFRSVVNLGLLLSANAISRKLSDSSLW
ncbi:MAG: protein lplB [Clostridiales bacterium]|jgi:putative aldouronate transport system permease protein|nr:protein lplB [Clostridiales bacterium]